MSVGMLNGISWSSLFAPTRPACSSFSKATLSFPSHLFALHCADALPSNLFIARSSTNWPLFLLGFEEPSASSGSRSAPRRIPGNNSHRLLFTYRTALSRLRLFFDAAHYCLLRPDELRAANSDIRRQCCECTSSERFAVHSFP
jgi:hypothetical protein